MIAGNFPASIPPVYCSTAWGSIEKKKNDKEIPTMIHKNGPAKIAVIANAFCDLATVASFHARIAPQIPMTKAATARITSANSRKSSLPGLSFPRTKTVAASDASTYRARAILVNRFLVRQMRIAKAHSPNSTIAKKPYGLQLNSRSKISKPHRGKIRSPSQSGELTRAFICINYTTTVKMSGS